MNLQSFFNTKAQISSKCSMGSIGLRCLNGSNCQHKQQTPNKFLLWGIEEASIQTPLVCAFQKLHHSLQKNAYK